MACGFLVWSGKDSGNASFWPNGFEAFFPRNFDVFWWWWVCFVGGGGGGGGGLWVRIGGDFAEALVLKWRWLLVKGFDEKRWRCRGRVHEIVPSIGCVVSDTTVSCVVLTR
jgi:hypothetical protein